MNAAARMIATNAFLPHFDLRQLWTCRQTIL